MITDTKIIEKAGSAYEYPLLIKQLLHTSVVHARDNEIVYRGTMRFTYDQLMERMKRLASGLGKIGVTPGDVVAFLDWDSYRYLEGYFAIPGVGAVLHTVNVRLSPEQILFTMDHASDAVVFVHQDFVPIVESIAHKLPLVKKWILIREPDQPAPDTKMDFYMEYEALLALGEPDHEFPEFDENSMATLSYTTGTTGDPKGVYFSHRQIVLHTLGGIISYAAVKPTGGLHAGDIYMPMTPMFHVHAWGFPYQATMLGLKQVYPGRYEPDLLVHLQQTEGVTFSHCVPTIMNMVLDSPAAAGVDFTGWKVCIGGSALTRGLAGRAMNAGIDIYPGYGMSETCPVVSISKLGSRVRNMDREAQLDYRCLTGMPAPLVDVRIMDHSMTPLPMDGKSIGEICIRAPWLTQGYLNSPQKSEELWEGGYLHTGDVAVQNPDGFFQITDRMKDVVKTGGEWVSTIELEDLISGHPSVAEVAVVGIPDDKWGERPMALVVPAEGHSCDAGDIRQYLMQFVDKGAINKWSIPQRVEITREIPKTSVGKIDKKRIRSTL